jgi:hypothetical protein
MGTGSREENASKQKKNDTRKTGAQKSRRNRLAPACCLKL